MDHRPSVITRSSSDLARASSTRDYSRTPSEYYISRQTSRDSRDYSYPRGSSSRCSMSSMRELHLVGQCTNCGLEFKCACCMKCSHVTLTYIPVSLRVICNSDVCC
uniref:Uncharacterized protein n=1 Tax=Heterorhabditis bacteriophora TaxID=37862 RepID=A0A1I7XBU0_HETBA